MAFYNLNRKEDRERLKNEMLDQLKAVEAGTFPRTLNEMFYWKYPGCYNYEYVKRMCNMNLEYLDGWDARRQAEQEETNK